mmetsp:Transcript_54318/g.165021  ORF Transcript_54318/g.165021 Transcript_54318/m.165021 type:complete len:212 (+) Transcript_54318:876-1511(+)
MHLDGALSDHVPEQLHSDRLGRVDLADDLVRPHHSALRGLRARGGLFHEVHVLVRQDFLDLGHHKQLLERLRRHQWDYGACPAAHRQTLRRPPAPLGRPRRVYRLGRAGVWRRRRPIHRRVQKLEGAQACAAPTLEEGQAHLRLGHGAVPLGADRVPDGGHQDVDAPRHVVALNRLCHVRHRHGERHHGKREQRSARRRGLVGQASTAQYA